MNFQIESAAPLVGSYPFQSWIRLHRIGRMLLRMKIAAAVDPFGLA